MRDWKQSNKCQTIIDMRSLTNKKEVKQLTRCLAFCPASSPTRATKLSWGKKEVWMDRRVCGRFCQGQITPHITPDPHSPEWGLTFIPLCLGHRAGGELSPRPRNRQHRKTCVLRKQSVQGRWDALPKDWEVGVSCCYCNRKTQAILPGAHHPGKNPLPYPTSIKEARPGKKNGIMVSRALGIRHPVHSERGNQIGSPWRLHSRT